MFILANFSCLCHFPQVFGQVKEWLILELHEMIRMPHVVAYPKVFILVCDLCFVKIVRIVLYRIVL